MEQKLSIFHRQSTVFFVCARVCVCLSCVCLLSFVRLLAYSLVRERAFKRLCFACSSWFTVLYLHGSVTFVWNWNIFTYSRVHVWLFYMLYWHSFNTMSYVCSHNHMCSTSWWLFLISDAGVCVLCVRACILCRLEWRMNNKMCSIVPYNFHRILIATFSH